MSQNHPFVFSAGGGSHLPSSQPQYGHTQAPAMPAQAPGVPSQQAAFQQNAQLLGFDMSALDGISPEQLAAIARLFQAGALQMPPPPPSTISQTSPNTSPASAPLQPTPSLHQPPPIPPATADVDMDTEEGEVNESEGSNTPAKSRDFLRPPPTGPKNRSLSPREQLQNKVKRKPSPRPPLPAPPVNNQSESDLPQTSQAIAATNESPAISMSQEAKMFVLEVIKAGRSYEDIAPNIRNPMALTRMFKKLGLPTPSTQAAAHPNQPSGISATRSQPQGPVSKLSPSEEPRKTSLTKRPAPAKPAPVDRSEYLARLQAAKNKKTDSAAVKPTPQEPEPALETVENTTTPAHNTKPAPPPPSVGAPGSSAQPSPARKAATMTELARKKLEALKALRAAKQNGVSVSDSAPNPASTVTNQQVISSPSQRGLGAGIADIPSQLAQDAASQPLPLQTTLSERQVPGPEQQTVSPTPQTPSRSFSSLPGLFMFDTTPQVHASISPPQTTSTSQPPAQSTSASIIPQTQPSVIPSSFQRIETATTASPAQLGMSRKRPVASDFDDTFARPSSTKRPFGQSRNASEDESLVIQVSDDEDENDEMDVEPIPGLSSNAGIHTKSFRDVGPLRDFPPKPNFPVQTSGSSTPGGIAYEQKMKEIEEFKRRIAEKERKKKANGRGTPTKSGVIVGIAESPTVPATALLDYNMVAQDKVPTSNDEQNLHVVESSPVSSLPKVGLQHGVSVDSRSTSTDRPMSAAHQAKQQEKEMLRKRLLELEQEEIEVDSEVVDAASMVAETQHAMSGALPGALSDASHRSGTTKDQLLQTSQEGTPSDTSAHNSPSEEGELSDDSLSNLYNHPSAQDTGSEFASSVDNSRVGAKVTIAGATGEREANIREEPQPPASEPQSPGAFNENGTIAEVPTSQASVMTAIDFQRPLFQTENMDTDRDLYDPATEVGQDDLSRAEMMEENGGEEDSSEDSEDTGDGPIPTHTHMEPHVPVGIPLEGFVEERDMEGQESSTSASSAEPQDMDSEPLIFETRHQDASGYNFADSDLAPELQTNAEEQAVVPTQNPAKPMGYFTPYRSPLAAFTDYRYHPEYLKTVLGGYRSLTYNHNIDPANPLCPFETAGGKCNDPTCQNQHFKSMVVSDNELLKTMGTKNIPAHNAEDIKRWNEGLGAVVRELRNTNLGKDANTIATKIAEFRREFVGDPTKTLNLG